ncbi:bifunctional glutamate N-acetyltransferase/amino-acid acetyltransferase ArgJ [Acanthopleuribacter pedis]|uniref:Arginine biosynthesis bifunctional protein ArgJ n=1 Tax=Acanthopleuribacter pedis TaxID=442870 RepID=A0A8J7QG11_9BACT|nr:bifunctional glutamate N-acetyltransferase/amino-acid acetyltransferase ArgJ [Acanthopleuribacter pedis]MBO1317830.1 bifunctional glutamate N-acetyltransferase/amino-acid acetyltransferase ArgJ [Acanthopleuribacter pedis]
MTIAQAIAAFDSDIFQEGAAIPYLPAGFQASGVAAGIKKTGDRDVALFVSKRDCALAAVYTTNQVQAAPIRVSKQHHAAAPSRTRAVVLNSGNANAVTGAFGEAVAREMARQTAAHVVCEAEQIVVMSTGVIGVQLPRQKVLAGITQAAKRLSPAGGGDAAEAMRTTDTCIKFHAVKGEGYHLTGYAKGSGMIHPNMATMLAVVMTDAAVPQPELQACLQRVNQKTFNCISVDGDMSTNDTVAVLANGATGVTPDLAKFEAQLTEVLTSLATQIVADGEGATKMVTLDVEGTVDDAAAQRIGKAVATSMLFKTAIHGEDANWGRVLAALGAAGEPFDPDRVDLWFGGQQMLENGRALPFSEAVAQRDLSEKGVSVRLALNGGSGAARIWTTDLSAEYVAINGSYRS